MQNLDKKVSVDQLVKEIINQNIKKNKRKISKKKYHHWRFAFSQVNLMKLIVIILISIALTIFYFQANKQNVVVSETINSNVEDSDFTQIQTRKIKVYVSGEVKKSGVYELSSEARLIDALSIAGGLSEGGTIGENNLARILQDGEQIHFENKNNLTKGVTKNNIKKSNCININDSDEKQLDGLPGVGPVLAQRILEYRQANGKFIEVSHLSNVEGIGKSKLKTISEKACV